MRAASRWLAAAALTVGVVGAQMRVTVPDRPGPGDGDDVIVDITAVTSAVRPGGSGHVRLVLQNPDRASHRITMELVDYYYSAFRADASVELAPGETTRLFLRFPALVHDYYLVFRCDDGPETHGAQIPSIGGDGAGVSVLLVAGSRTDELGWKSMLERRVDAAPPSSVRRGNSRTIPVFQSVRPVDLPPDWTALSGFDLVVVDARAEGLGTVAQQVLRDYLRTGGRVLVAGFDVMPEGPLRDALEGEDLERGFGMSLTLDADAADPGSALPFATEQALSAWLERDDGFVLAGERATSGPLPPSLFQPLEIPGLGRAPLRAFFLLICVFAIVVGPLNYLHWRRKKRLPMLLVTVPALGFVTTVLLLGYGVLSEGLGIRGALRSFTILDQVEQEAVNWTTRTVYAGVSPSRLTPRPGSEVASLGLLERRMGRTEQAYELALDGTLGGALVPSRRVTTLGVASLGSARERLRFERRDDGGWNVLAGDDFAPEPGAGSLVFRDPAGGWWIQRDDGRLSAATAADGTDALYRLVDRALEGDADDRTWVDWLPLGSAWPNQGPVARFLRACAVRGSETLAPGHYVAWLATPCPATDELDLVGEYLRRELVLGRIGPEDILD